MLTTISPLSPSEIAPSAPAGPVAPVSPLGIAKSNVAALDDPELVTVALEPAAPVVTVPTAMVAAAPSLPLLPLLPASPLGIVKFSVAAVVLPTLVTEAFVPAFPVVTVPIVTVAEPSPCGP